MTDYLKISRANELTGRDRIIYRALEIFPGAFAWSTLIILVVLSFIKPIWVSYFIIAFDVYWLLLVMYLGIHLIVSYKALKKNMVVDWKARCENLPSNKNWQDIIQLIILPTYKEELEVIRPTLEALANDSYPGEKMIVVLAVEERAGEEARERALIVEKEFGKKFRNFLITVHPDNIEGELKGKGANQAWAAKEAKRIVIDRDKLNYDKILASVFDIDTVIYKGYFYNLTYKFLTAENPYRASYQPIPVYFNNIWQAPFFARVAASSNTFWQMMQQIRQEKLATYSSHSMTWRALVDVDFWSTNMVSEDSRIFWHCFSYYQGDYRVEPLYFPVSMDVCMDETAQQRRWGWGVENVPYLVFNFIKDWKNAPKGKFFSRIFVQVYGFHSWATNALIIALIGWLPLIFGGDQFNATALSTNLPAITRNLMTCAMAGLFLSAIISTLLLPPRPEKYGFKKSLSMILQWAILPVSIIIFGAIPALESQTRLMLGKYMGFWVTPKVRKQ
jgi:hypothetical protein